MVVVVVGVLVLVAIFIGVGCIVRRRMYPGQTTTMVKSVSVTTISNPVIDMSSAHAHPYLQSSAVGVSSRTAAPTEVELSMEVEKVELPVKAVVVESTTKADEEMEETKI